MERLTNCDKCHSKIENGKCSCGFWYENNKAPPFSKCLERAIESFNFQYDQGQIGEIFSGDHHSGTCIILFRGNYEICMKVKNYINGKVTSNSKNILEDDGKFKFDDKKCLDSIL